MTLLKPTTLIVSSLVAASMTVGCGSSGPQKKVNSHWQQCYNNWKALSDRYGSSHSQQSLDDFLAMAGCPDKYDPEY